MSENIKLESLLNDPSLLAKKAYVAGEWINAQNGKTFDVINPCLLYTSPSPRDRG